MTKTPAHNKQPYDARFVEVWIWPEWGTSEGV